MGFWRRLWRAFIDFLVSEPGGKRIPSMEDARNAMLRELDGLRRIAALSRAQADALARRVSAAEQRSQTLEATAKTLVQQLRDDEAREALRLKLDNDRLVTMLREELAAAESTAAHDMEKWHVKETEVSDRLERMRQLESLEALNAQRRELEQRRREAMVAGIAHAFDQEEERIHSETYRLSALAGMSEGLAGRTQAEAISARKVEQAADEVVIEQQIEALKREVEGSS